MEGGAPEQEVRGEAWHRGCNWKGHTHFFHFRENILGLKEVADPLPFSQSTLEVELEPSSLKPILCYSLWESITPRKLGAQENPSRKRQYST